MFLLKKAGCRIFQLCFRAALPILPYREPEIIPSCSHLRVVFSKKKTASVLIVTDRGVESNGLILPVCRVLDDMGIEYRVYSKTQPNPTVENVEEGFELYREFHCDTLIAVGGGSSMDCAKAIGARAAYPKRSLMQMGGVMRILKSIPTLIAIPTTAGTGSETTPVAVITDSKTHHKYALMSFPLIPHYAVLDASLTCSLPPHLTATTGMDALTHAVEAYIGRSTTAGTRRLALEATELVFQNVEKAYNCPTDNEARENMLHAAYKAGIALSKSYVGYIHAVAHSLGGKYSTPHGLANAVTMPYVLESYGSVVHKKLHRLGVAAGVCSVSDSYAEGASKFIEAVKGLNKRMNIPDKITGIKEEDIVEMARYAEKEANPLYPVPKLMTRKELESFYYTVGGLK